MRKRITGGLIIIIIGFGIFIAVDSILPDSPFKSAQARSQPDHANINIDEIININQPPVCEIEDLCGFNLDDCNQTGNAEIFYGIGNDYPPLEEEQETAETAQYYAAIFQVLNQPVAFLYRPDIVRAAGVILGYQIAQSGSGSVFINPCGCNPIDGSPYPPQLCPDQGCYVAWYIPDPDTDLEGDEEVKIIIDPSQSCTDIYLKPFSVIMDSAGNPQKGVDLGWVDCNGSAGFEISDDIWNHNGTNYQLWESTCNFRPFHAFVRIYLQVRAQGCYMPLNLTNDPINNPNTAGDENNPVFGPFNLPGMQTACISNWVRECTDCIDGTKTCSWYDYGGSDGQGCESSVPPGSTEIVDCTSSPEPAPGEKVCEEEWHCNVTSTSCPPDGYAPLDCQTDLYDYCVEPPTSTLCRSGDTCIQDWECTDWSACINGIQTRECDNKFYCHVPPVTSQDCESDDDSSTPPSVNMTIPKEGDEVYGSITLTAKATGSIDSLTFYWDKIGSDSSSNTNVLVGSGRPLSGNPTIWERTWDTTQTPNGGYSLYARIESQNGNYYDLSNKTTVTINNNDIINIPESPSATETPDDLTDTDYDILPDLIENEIGTDLRDPDTDDDKKSDSQEVIEGSNPTGEGDINKIAEGGRITKERIAEIRKRIEKIAFEEPKTKGAEKADKLKILEISNISERIGENKVVFTGIGPANSYLRLYIYSTPIVVTTKTDASGNFVYTLDKNLADGQHEVYVTITDDTGKIQEKSTPVTFFIRKAQAVSEEKYLRGDVNVESDSTAAVNNYLWLALTLVGGAIVLLLLAYILGKSKLKGKK
ncbi:hypothetical protein KKC06_04210 [Patescibacteria group bacterium]|nr:hypothetical protein [Patescibacteria group bacterium]